MKSKRMSVGLVLALLAVLMLAPGSVVARALRSEFTGTETPLGMLDPGVWTELPSGNLHVRGMTSQSEEIASDARMSGVNTVVMNANWRRDGTGPMWGTSYSEIPPGPDCAGGGVWEGTWTGTMNWDGSYTYRAAGRGVAGCVEGLHFALTAVSPGGDAPTTYSGEILDPHGE